MGSSFVRVTGLRELGATLKRLDADIQERICRRATAAGARVIQESAQRRAPVAQEPYVINGITVQPRNLPSKIKVTRVKPSDTPLTSQHLVVVLAGAKHGYASRVGSLQEFGTVKMQANPFMRPAFDEDGHKALDAIVNTVRSGVAASAAKK
jgi:HK97 gp10 family phage protein